MELKLIKTNTGYRIREEEYYPNYNEAGIRRVLKSKGYAEQTVDYILENVINEVPEKEPDPVENRFRKGGFWYE